MKSPFLLFISVNNVFKSIVGAPSAAPAAAFCDFVSTDDREVPDPYYGGVSGFEKVLDLMDDGCHQILEHIQKKPA